MVNHGISGLAASPRLPWPSDRELFHVASWKNQLLMQLTRAGT